MHRRPTCLIVPCMAMLALLTFPAESQAGRIWDCLFGNAPPSQTTYAPAFAPVYAAPSCTTCAPCYTPCAPSCDPCVPQTCQYMPTVVYRVLYQPAGCSPWTGCTTTTYRPFLGTYQTRLVPYTTYRPLYVPAVTYQSCYNPCGSCCPASYAAPVAGCSTCAPAPQAVPQAEPKTFQEKVEKPATDSGLQPIPQSDTQLNSTPAPVLPDPNNRTAARPVVRQASRVQAAGYSTPGVYDRNDGGWYGADE